MSEDGIDLSDSFVAAKELGSPVVPPPFDSLSSAWVKGGW